MRIGVPIGLALLAIVAQGQPASAQETLNYRLVSHSVATITMDPQDGVEGHIVGSARFVGIAFFEDGTTARVQYLAQFDYINGSGTYTTINPMVLSDGSTLLMNNRGSAVTENGVTTFPDGQSEIVGGTGRYEGATGSCTFTGTRVQGIADGGDSYFDVTCTVQM